MLVLLFYYPKYIVNYQNAMESCKLIYTEPTNDIFQREINYNIFNWKQGHRLDLQ